MILDYYLGPYMFYWYIEPGSWFCRAPTDRYISKAHITDAIWWSADQCRRWLKRWQVAPTLKMSEEQLKRIKKKSKLNKSKEKRISIFLRIPCVCDDKPGWKKTCVFARWARMVENECIFLTAASYNILSVKCIWCFYGWSSSIGKGLNMDSL